MKIKKIEETNDCGCEDSRIFFKFGGSYFCWVEEKFSTDFKSEEDARLVADSFGEVKGRYEIV